MSIIWISHVAQWSGRKRTEGIWHTLSSGLDDYPRANWTSDVADRHVDLYSWIVMMHRVLMKMHQQLAAQPSASSSSSSFSSSSSAAQTSLSSTIGTLKNHVEAIHWNNATQVDIRKLRY